ncbi:hypothetical protein DQ04_03041100 [Trypanosoma grayi]|uniref:hypothetical protein n=1 Tax=Trypanosoma grayi TaxID=71804 RepID=UPI0004F4B295|nr:hypothetical protein DQ04_03041100 [Trypanosoma grayi]KEG11039.1 hypothetical protein DQ04_03041100 [Trypanosoma grayi]
MSLKAASHNISSIQKDQEYLHSHNVQGILQRLVADVVQEKPENACEYMAQWAAKQMEARRSTGTAAAATAGAPALMA